MSIQVSTKWSSQSQLFGIGDVGDFHNRGITSWKNQVTVGGGCPTIAVETLDLNP